MKLWKVCLILTTVLILLFAIANLPTTVLIQEVAVIPRIHTNKLNTVEKHTGDLPKISDKDNSKSMNYYLSSDSKGESQGKKDHKSILRKQNVHEDESTRKTNSGKIGQLQGHIGTELHLHTEEITYLKLKRKKQKRQVLIHGLYHRNITHHSVSDEEINDHPLALSKNKSKQLHKHFTNFLTVEPPKYLSNFRSPCWKEIGKDGLFETHCLPYFYLAGFPKCGTTDLFFEMKKHPKILMSTGKEPHWWTRNRFRSFLSKDGSVKALTRVTANFRWYLNQFKEASAEINATVDEHGLHSILTGEGSASTLWDMRFTRYPENKNSMEPKIVLANEIHHMTPQAKFIVILRNPTLRMYSDYLYFTEEGDPTTFHDIVVHDLDDIENCFRTSPERHCAFNLSGKLKTRLTVGLYTIFIEEWLKVFPREQFHILRLEDYTEDKQLALNDVFQFLGVGAIDGKQVFNNTTQRNARSQADAEKGPMLPETKRLLDDFYRPFNTRLAHLLHDERYVWL